MIYPDQLTACLIVCLDLLKLSNKFSKKRQLLFYLWSCQLLVILTTFVFTATHNALAPQRAKLARYHRPLPVPILVIPVDDDPVVNHIEFVGAGGVGIESRVMHLAALRM